MDLPQTPAPDLVIDPALDRDPRFGQLQIEASEPLHEDPLAAVRPPAGARSHWDGIGRQARALIAVHPDLRLHVLLYRVELAQRGLLAAAPLLGALGRLAAVGPAPEAGDDATRDAVAAALGYFFSETHLRELQGARFEVDGPTLRAVLEPQAAPVPERGQPRATGGGAGGDGEGGAERASRADLAAWLLRNRALLGHLKAQREALRALARGHGDRDALRPLLRKERVTAWLGRLESALLALGAVAQPDPALGLVGARGPDRPALAVEGGRPDDPDAVATIVLDPERMRRVDVVALLQIAQRWFAQNEPGSPVPYFLARALGLMNADFQEIVRALLPESLAQFNRLAGLGDRP